MKAHVSNSADEVSLLRDAAAGSNDAFLQLVRAYDGAVLNLAVRVAGSGEHARHVYREVFLKLHRDLVSIEPGTLRNHIYRLAAQVCLNHLRQGRVYGGEHALEVEPLDRTLRTIRPRERIVFELRHYERLGLREVSETLDISVAAAKVAFVRASGRLRCALASTSGRQDAQNSHNR
jgi:RNA polymerase sigma-70 factor (ECF subfamily)